MDKKRDINQVAFLTAILARAELKALRDTVLSKKERSLYDVRRMQNLKEIIDKYIKDKNTDIDLNELDEVFFSEMRQEMKLSEEDKKNIIWNKEED